MRWSKCAAVLLVSLVLAACSAAGSGPTTWIDRPLDGDQVALELVPIQAHASDASGVSKFEFRIDDSLLSSASGSGTRFSQAMVEWVPPAPGTYVVRARAINSAGTAGPEAKAVIVVGNPTLPSPPLRSAEPTAVPKAGTGEGGTFTPTPAQPNITVTPPPPSCPGVPIISSFTANSNTIGLGSASTLTWSPIANADRAEINQGVGQANVSGGSVAVQPTTNTTYVLTATGCGGTVVQSVTILILTPTPTCPGPPVISSFSANPGTITAGQSTTLAWGAVTNATSAAIDPGIGGVGTPGSTVVSPGGTTTYTLTATGCGGTTRRQVTVVVNPAPVPPTLTPPPPKDTTPPSISNVAVNPPTISQGGCGQPLRTTVSATVADAGGVDHVVARVTGIGDVPMGAAGGNSYRADLGPFGSAGQFAIRVVAWDRAGNSAQSGPINVNVVCIK